MTLETLLEDAKKCPVISGDAAQAYADHMNRMAEDVDFHLMARPDLEKLIGSNPLRVMRDNHKNHAAFMATVFAFNNLELLCRVLPWVYRTYESRGFSFDYFPVELTAWQEAVRQHLEPVLAGPILAIYGWMMAHHPDWISLSRTPTMVSEQPPDIQKDAEDWTRILLKGDTRKSLELASESGNKSNGIASLYLDALQPALYRLGNMWEEGSISAAQEHLSTAIVSRIMAAMYDRITWPELSLGKAVIACTADEFHEIGARMVADLLEMDGWNVTFLGANTPEADLLDLLVSDPPDLLGISVSMIFNLKHLRDLITRIRNTPNLANIKILVGGQGTAGIESLWQATGADGWAGNGREAVSVARQWWVETEERG